MVAQQLAWLVAAFRAPSTCDAQLVYSCVSFKEVPNEGSATPAFAVAAEIVSLDPEEPRSCWNEILRSSIIVAGFPIPERSLSEVGLEIPLDIMARLGGVPLAVDFDGGYLLKGHTMAFVPVERKGDSVQWHFFHCNGSRIKYRDVVARFPTRLSVKFLSGQALSSTRAFLGWWQESHNNIGK